MKLTIQDGRDSFYTFDSNRILLLTATDEEQIKQVEFSTEEAGGTETWTKDVLEQEDGVKYVQVPNEFLNGDYTRLVCYAVALDSKGEFTRQKEVFRIKYRPQPEDWFLTYSERVTFASIKALTEQYKASAFESMNAAKTSETNAENSADLARRYAEEAEDVEVETGKYSSKHWNIKTQKKFDEVKEYVGSSSEPNSALGSIETARVKAINDVGTKKNNSITEIDTHVTEVAVPAIDEYVENTANPEVLRYGKEQVDSYINGTSKPELDRYVNSDKKTVLDQYTENEKKKVLDQYTEEKKGELDSYTNTDKKKVLDDYVNNVKKVELNTYTNDKKSELDVYKTAKADELNEHTVSLKGSLDGYTTAKEQEISEFTEQKKQEVQGVYQSDLNELKGDLSEVKTEIGLNKIVFSDFKSNKYIATNGATIDLSNIMVGSVNRKYAVVYCSEGDTFTVSGQGGESARLWAFADSSNVVLEVAESSIAEARKVITAPKNTAYLVINTSEDVDSYYGENKFDVLEEVANDLQFLVFYNGINIDATNKKVIIEAQPYLKGKTKKILTKNVKIDYSNYASGFYIWYNDITDEFYANTDTHTEPYFYLVGAFSVENLFKSFSFSKFTVDKMENDTLPYNTLGSMEDCITDWWIYPTSIKYEGMRNKCYIGYIDSKGYQGVMSYNINTKEIRRKVLRKGDYADDHNAPSVTILDDGTVMVVCANHGTEKYHYVYYSTKKESVEEFTKPTIYENSNGFVTYSQVFKCGGKWWMFYRVNDDSVTPKTWYWNYRTSTDGKSWSEEKVWLQSGTTQYYVIARPYNDNMIKLYMLSNASLGETDIRLGFIDCNTNKMLNSDMITQITSLDNLTSPIGFSAFNIICPKNAYNRLYSIASGTDLSFVIARGSENWDTTSYHYYKYNGRTWDIYDLPHAGNTFYDGYNYQGNHVEIVDTDTVVMCVKKNNKWYLELYNIVEGSFKLNKVIAESNSKNVKFIRPFKVKDWYAITYMKGYYTEYYEGYYTDMYISELT